MGTAEYFFLGGPGRDPNYNPNTYTTAAAYNWGANQGNLAASLWENTPSIISAYIFMDMEQHNGFNNWYSICNNNMISSSECCSVSFARAVINGFSNAVRAAAPVGLLVPGIYASGPYWQTTFGCNSCLPGNPGYLSNTYEWTYGASPVANPSLFPQPFGWTAGSNSAQFFGGETSSSPYAAMWQWTSGNFSNGDGDYNQIDESRLGYG